MQYCFWILILLFKGWLAFFIKKNLRLLYLVCLTSNSYMNMNEVVLVSYIFLKIIVYFNEYACRKHLITIIFIHKSVVFLKIFFNVYISRIQSSYDDTFPLQRRETWLFYVRSTLRNSDWIFCRLTLQKHSIELQRLYGFGTFSLLSSKPEFISVSLGLRYL